MSEANNDKPAGAAEPEKDAAPYELLPVEPSAEPAAAPKPRLEGPRFIDTVDDDVDLSETGADRAARLGSPLSLENTTVPATAAGIFVEPGRGDAAIVAAVGGGVCVAACVCASVFAAGAKFPAGVLTLLYILLQTVTGVGAVGVTAHLVGRSFGDLALGAARMFLAVSLLWLGFSVDLPIPGKFVETMIAIGLYSATLLITMRRAWRDVAKVGVMHFLLSCMVMAVLLAFAWAWGAAGAKP